MATAMGSRDQQVEQIVETLMREFEGQLAPDLVTAEVTRRYAELCETSRVEPFIPILAMRRARAGLRVAAERS
jgi:hypothetical protein